MTATPLFATPPTPPAAGSAEEKRWAKDSSISWNGGSMTAAYGNLAQTFSLSALQTVCAGSIDVQRSGYTTTRTNTIGGSSKSVTVPSTTYKRYPKHNASLAAAGEAFRIVTPLGEYTARVTGDIQDFVAYLCANSSALYGTITVYSGRGAEYGPFSPSSNP